MPVRGIRRRPAFDGVARMEAVKSDGSLAFEFRASVSDVRAEMIADLERILDRLDPPLRLVSSAAGLSLSAGDPHHPPSEGLRTPLDLVLS